ncbi:MAG: hypothetical protein EBU46_01380 [Nitrosomonadaceae bacterium]|nr:hypothetical protein [Nitrosomonadaceae bacterium]
MAFILKPDSYQRGEPMYKNSDIRMAAMIAINNGNYFYTYRTKNMNDDMKKAADLLDEAEKLLNDRLNKYVQTQERIVDQTKKISSAVRDSTQKMAEGLLRIEKQANFDNLERYVNLLERANSALSSLAELESNGKLNKISDALK